MLDLTDGKVDVFNHITVASVTMATYRALFMTEVYQVTVDGETFQALRKGGIYYPMNSQGLPDMDSPIDPALIQDKVFSKSHIPQAPATGYTGGGGQLLKGFHRMAKVDGKGIGTASDHGPKRYGGV